MAETWNFRDILALEPMETAFSCVGTNMTGKRRGERCLRKVNEPDCRAASVLLDGMDRLRYLEDAFPHFATLARLTLCVATHRKHPHQHSGVVDVWQHNVLEYRKVLRQEHFIAPMEIAELNLTGREYLVERPTMPTTQQDRADQNIGGNTTAEPTNGTIVINIDSNTATETQNDPNDPPEISPLSASALDLGERASAQGRPEVVDPDDELQAQDHHEPREYGNLEEGDEFASIDSDEEEGEGEDVESSHLKAPQSMPSPPSTPLSLNGDNIEGGGGEKLTTSSILSPVNAPSNSKFDFARFNELPPSTFLFTPTHTSALHTKLSRDEVSGLCHAQRNDNMLSTLSKFYGSRSSRDSYPRNGSRSPLESCEFDFRALPPYPVQQGKQSFPSPESVRTDSNTAPGNGTEERNVDDVRKLSPSEPVSLGEVDEDRMFDECGAVNDSRMTSLSVYIVVADAVALASAKENSMTANESKKIEEEPPRTPVRGSSEPNNSFQVALELPQTPSSISITPRQSLETDPQPPKCLRTDTDESFGYLLTPPSWQRYKTYLPDKKEERPNTPPTTPEWQHRLRDASTFSASFDDLFETRATITTHPSTRSPQINRREVPTPGPRDTRVHEAAQVLEYGINSAKDVCASSGGQHPRPGNYVDACTGGEDDDDRIQKEPRRSLRLRKLQENIGQTMTAVKLKVHNAIRRESGSFATGNPQDE